MAKPAPSTFTCDVVLRDIINDDLPIFFEYQLDPDANRMAAFTVDDPTNKDAFLARWSRIRSNPAILNKTILFNGRVVGNIARYEEAGHPEITYWIGKADWGKGIASRALLLFLEYVAERPLYARAAKDNRGSLRVLEKAGFMIIGEDKGFSNARREEVEEYLLRLSSS